MQTSPNGFNLITRFEGFKPTAYKDVRGTLTCGYGHTSSVTADSVCTTTQARMWLGADVATAEKSINELVKAPLTQNQFDALVSLVFNIGVGAFEESTLLRELNDGDYGGASLQFLQWRRAGSDKSALLCRRSHERTLFDTP